MLHFASARNDIVNSANATRDCIEQVCAALPGGECDLLVFNTTMGHGFQDLLAQVKSQCPDAEVVGMSTSILPAGPAVTR